MVNAIAQADLHLAEVRGLLEQRPLGLRRGQLWRPCSLQPRRALALLAMMVGEQHPLDALHADLRRDDPARCRRPGRSAARVAVAQHIDVAGVASRRRGPGTPWRPAVETHLGRARRLPPPGAQKPPARDRTAERWSSWAQRSTSGRHLPRRALRAGEELVGRVVADEPLGVGIPLQLRPS